MDQDFKDELLELFESYSVRGMAPSRMLAHGATFLGITVAVTYNFSEDTCKDVCVRLHQAIDRACIEAIANKEVTTQ